MAADLLVPLTLVLGDEELLVSRAVDEVAAAARAADVDSDVRQVAGAALSRGELLDLLAPSLFGERRVVTVRDAQDMDRDVLEAVLRYVADPLESVCLVLVHNGGAKARKLVEAGTAAGARTVSCPKVTRPGERLDFVRAEIRVAGRQATDEAVRAIVDAVGADLRELAGACAQLLADTTGVIDEQIVAQYHRGRAEASGFLVADRAVEGDAAAALELLRWALSVGVAPVLVSSALATALRLIARVAAGPRGSTGAVAKQLGMPPWKLERVQRQVRGWHPDGITRAVHACALADAAVKGAGTDAAYALERAVLAVVAARSIR